MPTKTKRRGVVRYRGVVVIDGKIVKTKWFGSKKEDRYKAKEWEDTTKKEILRQRRIDSIRGVTLAEWHGRYLDYVFRSSMAYKTYGEKYYAFDRFVDEFGDETRVEEVIPSMVLEYMYDQELERSGNAANKDRKNLSAGWNWAKEFIENWPLDQAHSNPFLVVPRRKEKRHERYIPPEEDYWTVYDHSEGQDRVILAAAYYLAARRGELWALEWGKDINLSEEIVRLKTGKTSDGQWKHTWLPAVKELSKELEFHKKKSEWKKKDKIYHDYVFWSESRYNNRFGNPFTARQQWLGDLCKNAGVKPFGMHAIRHLRAIRLFKDGASLGSIQKWLRHDKPSTTEVYLRKFGLDFDNLREVAEASCRSKVVKIGKGQ